MSVREAHHRAQFTRGIAMTARQRRLRVWAMTRLYRECWLSLEQIGWLVGLSHARVWQILRGAGVPMRSIGWRTR